MNLAYIYRLILENKQTLRFKGLQLPERSNTVEIKSKSGESLAELMQKNLNSSEAFLIRFSNQFQ
jgi:hypothetical protein